MDHDPRTDHRDDELHDHDRGLSHDLPRLLSRRRLLSLVGGGAGALALAACSSSPSGGSNAGTNPGPTDGSSSGAQIPEETGGPYPGDGSNGPNVLTESGIVRSDLTRSFGTASGVAAGVALTVRLTVLDTRNGSAALTGAAVYLWHCTVDGRYSLYSPGVTDENYLRGVQETGADGVVTFTTVFPGAYSGRWPHLHFEVYPSLAAATSARDKLRTSQLALPEDACRAVYATTGYEQSEGNLARSSLDSDMVFRDGYSLQLATITGAIDSDLTASLRVPV
jgi:protocatechuate 3,4-dioxygenase beta subunit